MKEIYKIPKGQNVATSEGWKHIDTEIKNFVYETEQVPENWEELKELVREKVYDDNRNGVKIGQCVKIEYILIDGKSFMPDGEILDEDNDVFAVNRTPQQMWNIIKSLIGEE